MKSIRSALTLILAIGWSIILTAQTDGYFVHTVRWFEDVKSISAKYGVPADVIIEINNLSGNKVPARTELLIPNDERYWKKPGGSEEENQTLPTEVEDSIARAARLEMEARTPHRTDSVRVGLALPFSSASEFQRTSSLDFYSGVLMAAKIMGNDGINVDLDVRDISLEGDSLSGLDESDFILGPIRYEDIVEAAASISDKIIISPLDQRAEILARSNRNIVQAPSRTIAQYADAIKWARQIHSESGDGIFPNFILLSSALDPETEREARTALERENIEYQVCTCSVQGEIENWETAYNPLIKNVVIIAISNEAALNNAVRNMSIEVSKENVIAFTGSKIRAYSSIPLENIHKADIHAVCSYYVDYSDFETREFIDQYKSFFKTSPSQFAFQGYDLALFAIKTFSQYGRSAWRHMVEHEQVQWNMLQTSIKLSGLEEGGLVNDGVRRVEFRPDYSAVLSK